MGTRRINDGFKWQMSREVLNDLMTRCLNGAGLASGLISTKVYNVNPIVYQIDGYLYSAAASAVTGTYMPQGAGYSTVASNKAAMFAIGINSAGSTFWFRGSAVSAGDTAYIGNSDIHTSVCVIGLFHVSNASTVSFTLGTTAIGSQECTSCTGRLFNVGIVPQGVIISE